jgi:hypothetical protein
VATLRREGDEVVLKLNDLEKAGALHGDVRVPAASVREVRVSTTPFRELRGLRAPGTGLPGAIDLCTSRYRGVKEFASLYRGGPAVVVELEGAGFDRLLVSAPDADAVAERIGGALR